MKTMRVITSGFAAAMLMLALGALAPALLAQDAAPTGADPATASAAELEKDFRRYDAEAEKARNAYNDLLKAARIRGEIDGSDAALPAFMEKNAEARRLQEEYTTWDNRRNATKLAVQKARQREKTQPAAPPAAKVEEGSNTIWIAVIIGAVLAAGGLVFVFMQKKSKAEAGA